MASDRALVLRVGPILLFRRLALEGCEQTVLTGVIITAGLMWGRETMAPVCAQISPLSNGRHAGTHTSLGQYGGLSLIWGSRISRPLSCTHTLKS